MAILNRFGTPYESTSDIDELLAVIATNARVTEDNDWGALGSSLMGRLSPPSYEDLDWKLDALDPAKLHNKSASEILTILVDTSPELSRALHEMHQQVVPAYSWSIKDADTSEESRQAHRIIERALDRLETVVKEPLSMKLEQLVSSGYLKGAFHTEVVFEDIEYSFLDFRVVDPFRAVFLEQYDTQRGQYQQLAMRDRDGGGYVAILSEFVQYVALNAVEGSPYGRSFVSSAIYPMVFLLSFMKAARRVIMTQAWPHAHISISRKELIEAQVNPATADKILKKLEATLKSQYESASAGSAFITGSEVGIEFVGAAGRQQLSIIEMMMNVLSRWIVMALKQYSLVFSISSTNALSTDAEQQLLAEYKFTTSFQAKLEKLVSLHLNQILRQAGNAMTAVFQLERDSSKIKKFVAEAQKAKFEAIQIAQQEGWLSRAEARLLMLHPEGLQQMATLLSPELPPDAEVA